MASTNNSLGPRKDIPAELPSAEERHKNMKQFTDAKQMRKKELHPAIRWFRDMFFSGRSAKDILVEVAETQIVPQMKDNFRNSLVSMLDLKIYKNHQPASSSPQRSASFTTNYVRFSDPKEQQKAALEKNKEEEQKVVESGYECPSFQYEPRAMEFLRSLHEYVKQYPRLTVHDLAWMQGKFIPYTWEKWGWEAEEVLAVTKCQHITTPGGSSWVVQLPQAHVLTD